MKVRTRSQVLLAAVFCAFSVAAYGQPQEDKYGVFIDKEPLRAFGVAAKQTIEGGSVDLKAPFRIELELGFDKSGKFDTSKTRVIKTEGDKNLSALVKDGIIAIGESGWFGYLRQMPDQTDTFFITVDQTSERFSAAVKFVVPSESRAQLNASVLQNFLTIASHAASNSTTRSDEALFLRNMRAFAEGSSYLITLSMPANEARDILTKGLTPKEA